MLYIICNPTAGSGRAKTIAQDILKALDTKNISYHYQETVCPGNATFLAGNAVKEGFQTVLAIGGDGTAYEVACALNGTQTAMGIIPAGTGNDFVKALGYPSAPLQALDHILSCPPRKTDTGLLDNKLFLNEIGTGFDVLALVYAEKAKKYCRGLLPYLYGVLCAMVRYKPIRLTYRLDDQEPVTLDALVCGVANGSMIGGGIPIAPKASVEDGLFDVVIVRYIPKWRLPPYLPKLLLGKILSFPETIYCRAKSVQFSAPDMTVNIDGELKSMDQVSLRISEGSLLIHR